MCYYDNYKYTCGDWKWGNFRQHCQREHRHGETCGAKLVHQTIPIPAMCTVCELLAQKQLRVQKLTAKYQRSSAAVQVKLLEEVTSLCRTMQQLRLQKERIPGTLVGVTGQEASEVPSHEPAFSDRLAQLILEQQPLGQTEDMIQQDSSYSQPRSSPTDSPSPISSGQLPVTDDEDAVNLQQGVEAATARYERLLAWYPGTMSAKPPQNLATLPQDASLTMHLRAEKYGLDKYPAKSHAQRVADMLGAEKGLIVLQATPAVLYPDSDQPMLFRQDRYFYYLTGCNEPDCYVTYDIGKDHLVLWLPPIDASRVVWSGRGSTVKEALVKYDIDDAKYILPSQPGENDGLATVTFSKHRLFREDDTFESSTPQGRSSGSQAAYKIERNEHLNSAVCRIRGYTKDRGSKLREALNSCRVIKDEHEIALIRRANDISGEAHKAVLSNLHNLTNEAEVEAEYMRVCIARHAKEQAYSPIAGSGPNAGILHYVKNDEDFGDRQMMVLDAGCEVSCYASDVTRSFPLNRKKPGHWPSKEAEDVYRVVEKIQEACIQQMKPGNKFVHIARLSARMALDGLLELGILKGDRDEIWEAGTEQGFYPHGLGHHLGLEVHDVYSRALSPRMTSDSQEPNRRFHRDADGVLWLAFEDHRPPSGATTEYTIRADIDTADPSLLDLAFMRENCIDMTSIPLATEERPLSRLNAASCALAYLNPSLRGEKGLLVKAARCLHLYDNGLLSVGRRAGMPTLPRPFDFTSSSLYNDDLSAADAGKDQTVLEPGMVITIEPGLYFNSFLLETFFFNNPKHSKFIDKEVLDRYMPVGGVRIEDDILVTRNGYENLTTALKGEEMLECVREGATKGRT